jgi:hypothetical protein
MYYKEAEAPRPYAATQWDLRIILSDPLGSPMPLEYTAPAVYVLNPLIHVAHLGDLPISLVVDTVMLPFVIAKEASRTADKRGHAIPR